MIIKNVGMKAVDSGVYKAMRNRAIFSKFLMERTKIIGNLGMGSSLSERSNRFFSSNINEKKKGIAFSSLLQLSQISYHRDLEYCYKVDPNNFELLLNYLKVCFSWVKKTKVIEPKRWLQKRDQRIQNGQKIQERYIKWRWVLPDLETILPCVRTCMYFWFLLKKSWKKPKIKEISMKIMQCWLWFCICCMSIRRIFKICLAEVSEAQG